MYMCITSLSISGPIVADPGSPHVTLFSVCNFLPVYIPYFLQILTLVYFTCTTPKKDHQIEQFFCCLHVLICNTEKSMSSIVAVKQHAFFMLR